ncbi:MAG: cytochrome c [Rhodanobacteraceae bacterium]|jgi:cytochrome c553|nr:cytochrome c [Rhodanobacteraceae bacterium]
MKRTLASLLFTTLAVAAGSAHASPGDMEAGKQKAVVCQACHGADGNATDPQYPRLAGQYRDYLARALHEYKSGGRRNPIMAGFVATLSDQDIQDLAAYFASLPDSKLTDLHKRAE